MNNQKLIKQSYSLVAVLTVLFLSACSTQVTETKETKREITPYIKETVGAWLRSYPQDNPQRKYLEDYYISDQELQEAFDELEGCLNPHNITSMWTPTKQGDRTGPSHESQEWYQRNAKTQEERNKALDEAMDIFLECEDSYFGEVVNVYLEQQDSLDGRDANIRWRDRLVACGFTEFKNKTSEEMSAIRYEISGNPTYDSCR